MTLLLLLLACTGPDDKAASDDTGLADSRVDDSGSDDSSSDDSGPDDSGSDDSGSDDSADTGPLDADGDGYVASEDCDDGDPDRWNQVGDNVGWIEDVNLAGICDGYCERPAYGSVLIDDASAADLRHLDCITEVWGDVSIACRANEVTELSLPRLSSVGGDLRSSCSSAERVDLPLLQSVQSLTLAANDALTELHAPSLVTVEETLSFYSVAGLQDLSGFSALERLGGLTLDGVEDVVDLSGMSALQSAPHTLYIADTPALTSLDGLPTLDGLLTVSVDAQGRAVDLSALAGHPLDRLMLLHLDAEDLSALAGAEVRDLRVAESPSMVTLAGIEPLALEALNLGDNPLMSDLSALSGVTALDTLRLQDLDALEDLVGLEDLQVVSERLELRDLPALPNLDGLSALEHAGRLELANLTGLLHLRGLAQLRGIDDDELLWITGNSQLSSLSGLEGVSGQLEDLTITNNAVLSDISALHGVEALSGLLYVGTNPCLAPADVDALIEAIGEENLGEAPIRSGNDGPC